ncbi:MAG: hypothetical protein K0U74_10200 [Alphaproteobacteria bacterium]|nr:hypothetical protein [Alphaproteobacteria bacterium]
MTEENEHRIAELINDAVDFAALDQPCAGDSAPSKPKLLIEKNDPHRTVAALRDILSERSDLFDRGAPVRLVKDRQSGAITARPVSADSLVMMVHQLARPVELRFVKGKEHECNARLPRALAVAYLDWHGEWALSPLNGIASTPLLRPDGSILSAAGYDAKTGMFLHGVPDIADRLPTAPNQEDARAALAFIRSTFATFCFGDAAMVEGTSNIKTIDPTLKPGHDETAFLTALMTAVSRPSLDFAPGFLLRAPQLSGAGAGKGLLVRSICRIAFGIEPHAVTSGADTQELEKRIAAELIAGGQVLFLDNINGVTFKSNLLASAITERPARVRVLGKSEMLPLNATALVMMTGNALTVSEDLTRRFIAIELDPRVEDPEARAFPNDMTQIVNERRIDLLVAALTIWRWGRSQPAVTTGKPLGGFTQWTQWVRDPLLALGCPDPVERMLDAKRHDAHRQTVVEVFKLWQRRHGDRPVKASQLHEQVQQVLDPQKRGRQYIERRVAALVGTRVGGFLLSRQAAVGKWGAATYALHFPTETDRHGGHRGDEAEHRVDAGGPTE